MGLRHYALVATMSPPIYVMCFPEERARLKNYKDGGAVWTCL